MADFLATPFFVVASAMLWIAGVIINKPVGIIIISEEEDE